jgi:hypothetical protein
MPRAKLTESYIKSVPQPARSLYELHWDTEAKGLTPRVTTTASRHFVFCYTADGSNKRHTIGRWIAPPSNRLGMPATREFVAPWSGRAGRPGSSSARSLVVRIRPQQKKEARAAREAAKQQAAKGITVATLAERYLEEHAKPNKRSWSSGLPVGISESSDRGNAV